MDGAFETTFKRKKTRQRFYSSMNYDEFYLLYGPPAPLFKPLEDPIQDLPPLDLQNQEEKSQKEPQQAKIQSFDLSPYKLDTIVQIDGSQNATQMLFKSPRRQFSDKKWLESIDQDYVPKRASVRNRSQSDNSQYLIFNFLQRVNQTGKKKVKPNQ